MHILFLTHYFWPEGNAPATRVYELSRRWVRQGHRVTVVTGVPNVPSGIVYSGYRNRRIQREVIEGVEVIRVWTFIAPNRGVVRRTLNYLSFMISAFFGCRGVKDADVVIATSPQFFCGWAGAWVSRAKRRPFILEVRDIWPESIAAVGAIGASPVIRFLQGLERRLYRAADHIVTVGEGYVGRLRERGVPAEKISVVCNGVDMALFSPRAPDEALGRRFGLAGKFVCSYIGTIGMACGLDVVLRAARRLKASGRDDICFLLVGDGAERAHLERESRSLGLDNVIFTGRMEKMSIPAVLSVSDACLVHLKRKELFRSVLPSKIFEAAAMQKPIILGVEGFAADLVREAECGICIEPENEQDLAAAVEQFAADGALREVLGQRGRDRLAPRHDYDHLAESYIQTVARLVESPRK